MNDPNLTIKHRLDLEAQLRQVRHEARAHQVRIRVREDVAAEVRKAQEAITQAEDGVLAHLPTPLPAEALEVITRHPAVVGKGHQLERLEEVFAPAQIDQAESLAKAIASESSSEPASSASSKPGRRSKSSGEGGGAP